jgi:hypothetical protein
VDPGGIRRSKNDAGILIRECLENGEIIPTKHFREELAAEELILSDVWCVIRRGTIWDEPEHNVATGDWTYRIFGTAADGQLVTVVFCFTSDEVGVLITVYTDAKRSSDNEG